MPSTSRLTPEQREQYLANRRAKYASDPAEREKRKAGANKWRKVNPDRKRELNRRWNAENHERAASHKRRWKDANLKKVRQGERERYLANRETQIQRQRLKRTGFTEEVRLRMIEQQGGRCAICPTELATLPPRHVHSDHCHNSGKPRGVLCHSCNAALGFFKDDPERMRTAIAYLERNAES